MLLTQGSPRVPAFTPIVMRSPSEKKACKALT
jgi:hypothetical protein